MHVAPQATQSSTAQTGGARRSDWFISTSDGRRFAGALIDAVQSFALFTGMLFLGDALFPDGMSLASGVAYVLGFLALDIAVYALPVSLFGWSLGSLLTGRRIIDRDSGQRLSMGNAVRRYRARRVQVVVARFKARFGSGGLKVIDATTSKADAAAGSAVISATTPAGAVLVND